MATTTPMRRANGPRRTVGRWTPFGDLDQIQQQLQQLVNATLPGGATEAAPAMWTPPVDIEETDDAWVIEAELPGVSREDVDIELHEDELVIRGEVKERERQGVLRRRTRKVGEFEFRVTLPGGVNADAIEAHLDNGVLTVRVPKAETARSRKIDIT
jgi:HSP20 family protein